MIYIKNEKEIELMAKAGEIMKKVISAVESEIKPGISTMYLDEVAKSVIYDNKATPSFYGQECPYPGGKPFKYAMCVSVNDEIIHGIPSKSVILQDGDVICIDLGVYKNGYHSDAGRTFGVGNITQESKKLIKVAKDAFFEGIKFAKVGYRIGDISNAIYNHVTKNGFTLLEEYQGHGIGKSLHEDPGVPNIGVAGRGPRIQKGMALAIEPMICAGSNEVYVKKDMWTVATVDKKNTAYYENTLIITENEPMLLTF